MCIGVPRFPLKTHIFSVEIPRLSLETPICSLETPRFSLESAMISLDTPRFSLKIWGHQRKNEVSNENLEVSNENMGVYNENLGVSNENLGVSILQLESRGLQRDAHSGLQWKGVSNSTSMMMISSLTRFSHPFSSFIHSRFSLYSLSFFNNNPFNWQKIFFQILKRLFSVAEQVKFGGHFCSEEGIDPNPGLIAAAISSEIL